MKRTPNKWPKYGERRCKRNADGYVVITYRKAFLLLTVVFGMFYLGPWLLRWTVKYRVISFDPLQTCLDDKLNQFRGEVSSFDAHIRHVPPSEQEDGDDDNQFLPFVGNGKIGVAVNPENDSPLYINVYQRGLAWKNSSVVLSMPIPFYPMVRATVEGYGSMAAVVTQYLRGLVHRIECVRKKSRIVETTYQLFAHREIPSLLVQDINIVNPLEDDIFVDVGQKGLSDWNSASKKSLKLEVKDQVEEVIEIIGELNVGDSGDVIVVCIVQTSFPSNVQVKSRSSNLLHMVMSVHYSAPVARSLVSIMKSSLSLQARDDLHKGLSRNNRKLREDHTSIWQRLWSSGFSISYSKASNALNGDKINATLYYVLSHTRAPLHEADTTSQQKNELQRLLTNPDRCYEGHPTLQASTLWSALTTVDDINHMVSLWKLTLANHGCYPMLKAGADGILQAMVLSFGALKFGNYHLEFCTEPKDLHRDYVFRRISYGNATHLNISVNVGEDNKATIFVVLDRTDKNYYACDAGCLDPPVQLSQEWKQFPVKLTDPLTAILYITADRPHMEQLKHTIHMKDVVEAPAHEHHVIALHRHGHHFGGLPTMFWVSITVLVAIFHLFLFKLIYNEYCSAPEKFRARHAL